MESARLVIKLNGSRKYHSVVYSRKEPRGKYSLIYVIIYTYKIYLLLKVFGVFYLTQMLQQRTIQILIRIFKYD